MMSSNIFFYKHTKKKEVKLEEKTKKKHNGIYFDDFRSHLSVTLIFSLTYAVCTYVYLCKIYNKGNDLRSIT